MKEESMLRFLVVGVGPTALYFAVALRKFLNAIGVEAVIDMVEADYRPGGLGEKGVFPGHTKIRKLVRKLVAQAFDEENNQGTAKINYLGGVRFGEGYLTVEHARKWYDRVIFGTGASEGKKLSIPGTDLRGSTTVDPLSGIYNGNPRYADETIRLDHPTIAANGLGNTNLDVLFAHFAPVDGEAVSKTLEMLGKTDCTLRFLEMRRASQVRQMHIIGRKAPAGHKFGIRELDEVEALRKAGVINIVVLGEDVSYTFENGKVVVDSLDEWSKNHVQALRDKANQPDAEATDKRAPKDMDKALLLFQRWSTAEPTSNASGTIYVHFSSNVTHIYGDGQVESIDIRTERPGEDSETGNIAVGMFYQAMGYKVLPLPGLPELVDGVIANTDGVIAGEGFEKFRVCGWAADGPTGDIPVSKKNGEALCARLVDELFEESRLRDDVSLVSTRGVGPNVLQTHLAKEGVKFMDYRTWCRVDAAEVEAGRGAKEREKFPTMDEMAAAAAI